MVKLIPRLLNLLMTNIIYRVLESRLQTNRISTKIKNITVKHKNIIYNRTKNYVRTGKLQSQEFVKKEGLKHGGVLSPLLFNIILDDIIKEMKD